MAANGTLTAVILPPRAGSRSSPASSRTVSSGSYGLVDDLLIDASVVAIDGPGRVLALAGPRRPRRLQGQSFAQGKSGDGDLTA